MKVGADFYSGVTAALIDRTNSPTWNPPTLQEVCLTCCACCHSFIGNSSVGHIVACEQPHQRLLVHLALTGHRPSRCAALGPQVTDPPAVLPLLTQATDPPALLLLSLQVTDEMVQEYFQPIPEGHELRLPALPGGGPARL